MERALAQPGAKPFGWDCRLMDAGDRIAEKDNKKKHHPERVQMVFFAYRA